MSRSAEEILFDTSVTQWTLVDAAKDVARSNPEKALEAYNLRKRWEIHFGITIIADQTGNQQLKDQLQALARRHHQEYLRSLDSLSKTPI